MPWTESGADLITAITLGEGPTCETSLHIRRNRDTELYVASQAKHQQRDLSLTNARVTFNRNVRELCRSLWVIRYGGNYISQGKIGIPSSCLRKVDLQL